jgi:hypothetical protein
LVYSQYNEEAFILANTPAMGSFLDVGAFHPVTFSNTRALYERGWSGVLIEPSPGPFLQLLRACSDCGTVPKEAHGERKTVTCPCGSTRRYGNDPRLRLVLAAVDGEAGIRTFQATDDAVTTADDTTYDKWKESGGYYGRYDVPCLSWEQVFTRYGVEFNFVNIDAEGISPHLFFNLMNLTEVRPKCICLEHEERLVEIQSRAAEERYSVVYTNGTNIVLVR